MLTETVAPGRIPIRDLQAALESVLAGTGSGGRVESVRRRRSAYSSSHEIDNVDVRLSCGAELRLVVKNLSPASRLPAARKVRPDFLYHAGREIGTYTRVLQARSLGTARCYGSVVSTEPERRWLFLERVEGIPLWQAEPLGAWEDAARWLARMHADFGLGVGFVADPGMSHLPRLDAGYYATWARRAGEFVRGRPDDAPSGAISRFERVLSNYDHVVRRLVRIPVTLVHGEYYPSNILVRPGGGICPVDWELAAVGPSLLDVAALASGEWNEAQRTRIVDGYRRALESEGLDPGPSGRMRGDIAACQLHLAMQWLGWAADWNPPTEHARDWLGEALRLAEELEIA